MQIKTPCCKLYLQQGAEKQIEQLSVSFIRTIPSAPESHRISGYINLFRNLMMYGNIPGPNTWIACIFCAVASMAIGLLVFRKLQKNLILYI